MREYWRSPDGTLREGLLMDLLARQFDRRGCPVLHLWECLLRERWCALAQGAYEPYELLEARLRRRSQPKIARGAQTTNSPEATIKGKRGGPTSFEEASRE